MAAEIKFDYAQMSNAVGKINDLAGQYRSAANTFIGDFDSAISTWEGDTQVAVKSFIDTAVNSYMGEIIPKLLESLAQLLEANINQMQNADAQIAGSISQSLDGSSGGGGTW